MPSPNIHPSWLEILENEFSKPYYSEIKKTIVNDVNL
jgi:hypothetical protein